MVMQNISNDYWRGMVDTTMRHLDEWREENSEQHEEIKTMLKALDRRIGNVELKAAGIAGSVAILVGLIGVVFGA